MGGALPELIRAQHAELRDLLAQLNRQPAVTEQILEPQLRARKRVLQEIERRFLAELAVRLRYLWPALRRAWPDGGSYADGAWTHGRTILDLMAKRRWFGERDAEANDLDGRIASEIEAELASEEAQLARLEGPPGRTGPDGTTLARQLAAPARWPTRPHPDVPRSARLASMLQRPLGARDRLLDRCGLPGR